MLSLSPVRSCPHSSHKLNLTRKYDNWTNKVCNAISGEANVHLNLHTCKVTRARLLRCSLGHTCHYYTQELSRVSPLFYIFGQHMNGLNEEGPTIKTNVCFLLAIISIRVHARVLLPLNANIWHSRAERASAKRPLRWVKWCQGVSKTGQRSSGTNVIGVQHGGKFTLKNQFAVMLWAVANWFWRY